jgi:lipoprotein-releasing system permease protein
MGAEKKNLTSLIKIIAILSISLGLTVMIIAVSVVTGFQNEIRNKVIGFGSHIQVSNFDYNLSYETRPISIDQEFYGQLSQLPGVQSTYAFSTKPGIIKTGEEIHGVIFMGVGNDFDWDFFKNRLTSGQLPQFTDTVRSDQIIISGFISKLLMLNEGDDVLVYYIQEPPRVRRFTITGVYETGLEEMDKIFILGDIRHVQRLNDWTEDQVGGIGINLYNYGDMHDVHTMVQELIPYSLNSRTINQIYPQIFDWLALLDMNVYVIIIIMIIVAGINMITTLLISVLEKTSFIGVLKALGASNAQVRKVFLYHAAFLISKGIIWGNLLGIGLAFLQDRYGFIKLTQESYFVDVVPVNFSIPYIIVLNVGTFVICMLMLLLPSYIVTRISPVKAITFR